jgi:hypothetical protein
MLAAPLTHGGLVGGVLCAAHDGVIVVCWLYWISMDRYRAATNTARRS